jgi:hypothetical protein
MSVVEEQETFLDDAIGWAERIYHDLYELQVANGWRVHFRPTSKGFTMVGLLHDRPQRGVSLGRIESVKTGEAFEAMFNKHCEAIPQGRPTPEKALQSYLIRGALSNARRLASISEATRKTNHSAELVFVTDEFSLPLGEKKKTTCDLLALRRDGGRSTPVLIELKSNRAKKDLKKQVERYAELIDKHARRFEKLYSAVLGESVQFDGPPEKWIVWPMKGRDSDPQEEALRGIRVIGYAESARGEYLFRAGGW